MNSKEKNRTLAFAAMLQAARLVQCTAQGESLSDEQLHVLLNSLLVTDPSETEEIYGGVQNLSIGFEMILEQLNGNGIQQNPDLTRYVANLISLERKLDKRPDLLSVLSERIEQIKRQVQHHTLTSDRMLENIAGIYSDLISPIGPQIRVLGEVEFLQKPSVQHRIRALLLAGLRACVLWRQLGGRRLYLFLFRGSIVKCAQKLASIKTDEV